MFNDTWSILGDENTESHKDILLIIYHLNMILQFIGFLFSLCGSQLVIDILGINAE